MTLSSILGLKGLPPNFADSVVNVSELRKDKIIDMIESFPSIPTKLAMYGNVGWVVSEFHNRYPNDIVGIDFREYFSKTFNNEVSGCPKKRFVIIYNVGLERAINVEFSSRLLQGLMKEIMDLGCNPILCLETPYSTFQRKYGININNVLNVPIVETPKLEL